MVTAVLLLQHRHCSNIQCHGEPLHLNTCLPQFTTIGVKPATEFQSRKQSTGLIWEELLTLEKVMLESHCTRRHFKEGPLLLPSAYTAYSQYRSTRPAAMGFTKMV